MCMGDPDPWVPILMSFSMSILASTREKPGLVLTLKQQCTMKNTPKTNTTQQSTIFICASIVPSDLLNFYVFYTDSSVNKLCFSYLIGKFQFQFNLNQSNIQSLMTCNNSIQFNSKSDFKFIERKI